MLYFRQSSVEVFLLALSFGGQGRVFTIATTFQIGQTKVQILVGGNFFSKHAKPALEPNQFPLQWVPGVLSLGDKAAGVSSLTSI
jgi:hypothetical protein